MSDIIEKSIEIKMLPWHKTFPDEFYKEICRLKGWPEHYAYHNHRTMEMARITNDIVYERLAPHILDELQRINPWVPEVGGRRNKHHQYLTTDLGHPKLREHLVGVMALMRSCEYWREFEMSLWKAYPSYRDTKPLLFPPVDQESA